MSVTEAPPPTRHEPTTVEQGQLRRLRSENAELRAENAHLRCELAAIAGSNRAQADQVDLVLGTQWDNTTSVTFGDLVPSDVALVAAAWHTVKAVQPDMLGADLESGVAIETEIGWLDPTLSTDEVRVRTPRPEAVA